MRAAEDSITRSPLTCRIGEELFLGIVSRVSRRSKTVESEAGVGVEEALGKIAAGIFSFLELSAVASSVRSALETEFLVSWRVCSAGGSWRVPELRTIFGGWAVGFAEAPTLCESVVMVELVCWYVEIFGPFGPDKSVVVDEIAGVVAVFGAGAFTFCELASGCVFCPPVLKLFDPVFLPT